MLTEDTLAVELRAGPAAQLTVEGPATIECGTKATLPQLRVRVCDAAGNPTTSETFEVRTGKQGRGQAATRYELRCVSCSPHACLPARRCFKTTESHNAA